MGGASSGQSVHVTQTASAGHYLRLFAYHRRLSFARKRRRSNCTWLERVPPKVTNDPADISRLRYSLSWYGRERA
jgi:hypothetical protein